MTFEIGAEVLVRDKHYHALTHTHTYDFKEQSIKPSKENSDAQTLFTEVENLTSRIRTRTPTQIQLQYRTGASREQHGQAMLHPRNKRKPDPTAAIGRLHYCNATGLGHSSVCSWSSLTLAAWGSS